MANRHKAVTEGVCYALASYLVLALWVFLGSVVRPRELLTTYLVLLPIPGVLGMSAALLVKAIVSPNLLIVRLLALTSPFIGIFVVANWARRGFYLESYTTRVIIWNADVIVFGLIWQLLCLSILWLWRSVMQSRTKH